jgi:uncharacterized membrane protein YeaQ/YmgE (transglycosylase-associated protein family)
MEFLAILIIALSAGNIADKKVNAFGGYVNKATIGTVQCVEKGVIYTTQKIKGI